jgi:hypothetical protein
MNMVLTCEHVLISKYDNRKGKKLFANWDQISLHLTSHLIYPNHLLLAVVMFKICNKGYQVDPQVSYLLFIVTRLWPHIICHIR